MGPITNICIYLYILNKSKSTEIFIREQLYVLLWEKNLLDSGSQHIKQIGKHWFISKSCVEELQRQYKSTKLLSCSQPCSHPTTSAKQLMPITKAFNQGKRAFKPKLCQKGNNLRRRSMVTYLHKCAVDRSHKVHLCQYLLNQILENLLLSYGRSPTKLVCVHMRV